MTLLLLLALASAPNGESLLDSAWHTGGSSWEAQHPARPEASFALAQAGPTQAALQKPLRGARASVSGAAGLLPDPILTPGHVATTDRATVCERGYSRRVRKVSTATKRAVMRAYGIDPDRHPRLEMDHSVPLCLGGSNDKRNLWPQLARPEPGYLTKDKTEWRAHLLVCSGQMDLQYAQRRMAEDWISFHREVFAQKAIDAERKRR